ncbi:hypothetical protein yinte0001_23010 [Yersinia intermedia ATCC 29909]|nr:hypothetical protein yinte0001_23010 [Yersinia intermedia ATCC 29909]
MWPTGIALYPSIRIFTNPAGWISHLTGSELPQRIPLYQREFGGISAVHIIRSLQ